MVKRKLLVAACCALILCTLTGCRLAKESAHTNAYEDKLIGVFITTKHLDLLNLDGRSTQKNQGRLYAVLVPRTDINEETGEAILSHEYIFDGLDGIQYCVPTIWATEENSFSYITTASDPAISNGFSNFSSSDNEKITSIEGTIFVTPSTYMTIYHFNPVYQSTDGSVYAVAGNGFLANNGAQHEGAVFSHTLGAITTLTENGKIKKDSMSIKVSLRVMFTPEKIVILQMGPDDVTISRTEYKPDEMPKDFTLATGTAYFIVETHKRDGTGNMVISREIYDRDVKNIITFFARADGACVQHWTQIIGK